METKKSQILKDYIKAGYCLFPVTGKKVPLIKDWQNIVYSDVIDPTCLSGNFGVTLQPVDLVIDIDPRGFADGDKPHQRLCKMFPGIKDTLVVETGTGGLHMYLKKPGSGDTRKHLSDFKGIDFLRKGDFVVGAGSTNSETNKEYTIVRGDFKSIAVAPPKLIEMLAITKPEIKGIDEFTDDRQTFARFKKWLKTAPVAIEGQGGNHTTFRIACKGRAFGLSPDAALNAMHDWNKMCQPMWSYDSLQNIVNNAYTYNEEAPGKLHPHADFDAVVPEKKKKKMHWHLTKQGEMRVNSVHNIVNFFEGYKETEELDSLLRFNLLSSSIEFTRRPFWTNKHEPLTPWDDNDANAVMKYLSTKIAFNVSKNFIHDAALAVAQENKFHPIIEYLEGLKWDGKKRIGNWLTEYLGTADTRYEQTVGELMLVAAVKRLYQSGCKYKTIVIIEGDQGAGKSPVCEILGGDWYADMTLNVHSPDTVDSMRTKWIVEVSEMECTKRAETQALKAFLSRQVDTCRLAYARASKDFPRHNIFIGTFNPDNTGGYLKDMSGNTRYLPVLIPEGKIIDLVKLKRDRDQLWAEALEIYKSNPEVPLFIKDREIMAMAERETEKRRPKDAWIDKIRDWLDNPDGNEKPRNFARGDEIFINAIGGDTKNLSNFEWRRVANVMQDLGWGKSVSHRVDGKVQRGYVRPRLDPLRKTVDDL